MPVLKAVEPIIPSTRNAFKDLFFVNPAKDFSLKHVPTLQMQPPSQKPLIRLLLEMVRILFRFPDKPV